MEYVMILYVFTLGVAIGGIFVGSFIRYFYMKEASGTLHIDTSDPHDDPYLFLELSEDVNDLKSKKYIGLFVSTENLNTPK